MRRSGQIIPVAVAPVSDETAIPRSGELRSRLRGSLGLASSEAATVLWV